MTTAPPMQDAMPATPPAATGEVTVTSSPGNSISSNYHVDFDAMDANDDGRVTADEMKAEKERTAPKAASAREMSAEEKIKAVDTNGDGMLSREEHETAIKTTFDEMDSNKDGSLSKSELKFGRNKMMKPATTTSGGATKK